MELQGKQPSHRKNSSRFIICDDAGNWILHSPQLKTQQEHTISLLCRAAAVIREQQQAVWVEQSSTTRILFPNPKGFPFSQRTSMSRLNRIAPERDICDAPAPYGDFKHINLKHVFLGITGNNL